MENVAVHKESDVESMETEYKPATVEVTSFTESIEEIYLSKIIEVWPKLESALERHGLTCTLNQAERSITVSTTTRTRDPHFIDRARVCIVLISQFGHPRRRAIAGLDGEGYYDCIKTGYQEGGIAAIHGMKKELYIKRRKLLFKHIKELAHACCCGIYIGEDCVVVGAQYTWRLKEFRKIVGRCILKNMDPATEAKKIDKIYQYVKLQRKIKTMHI